MAQNVTIDDTFGDPITDNHFVYSPSFLLQTWEENGCSGCGASPDSSLAFNGSWHDATFMPLQILGVEVSPIFSASVKFNGAHYGTVIHVP